jgi:hypothetical protein
MNTIMDKRWPRLIAVAILSALLVLSMALEG